MTEFWDLYYPDGSPSGEVLDARERIPDDRRTQLVHFFIFDRQGRVLLQKRSMKKKYFPGVWDGTGGRVQAGEELREAACRELFEELGLRARAEDFVFISRCELPWWNIINMYCLRLDFSLSDCHKQDEEVDEVCLLGLDEVRALFRETKDGDYLAAFEKAAALMAARDGEMEKKMKLSDINIRDPFIMVEGGRYYMYGTRGADTWGLGTGFDVYESSDLEDWDGPFEIFSKSDDFWVTHNFWAPECHKYRGEYYLLASFKAVGVSRGTQILKASSPRGVFKPWSDGVVTPRDWECLDGTFYMDGGRPYIVFSHEWVQAGNGEVYALELSTDLRTPVGEPKLLFRANDAPWPKTVRHSSGMDGYVTDGPELFVTDGGKLILFWSSIAGVYHEGAAVSESGSVLGPWRQLEPIFTDDGGHGMAFRDLSGAARFVLHQPNRTGLERPKFFTLREKSGSFYLE